MGVVRLNRLEDMAQWHAELQVTCPRCGNQAMFSAHAMVRWFQMERWNTSLDVAPYRFRCTECGTKPCRLRAKMPEGQMPPERPRPKQAPPCPAWH